MLTDGHNRITINLLRTQKAQSFTHKRNEPNAFDLIRITTHVIKYRGHWIETSKRQHSVFPIIPICRVCVCVCEVLRIGMVLVSVREHVHFDIVSTPMQKPNGKKTKNLQRLCMLCVFAVHWVLTNVSGINTSDRADHGSRRVNSITESSVAVWERDAINFNSFSKYKSSVKIETPK